MTVWKDVLFAEGLLFVVSNLRNGCLQRTCEQRAGVKILTEIKIFSSKPAIN